MTILLRQSTAVVLKLGPFVDEGDAVTPETALTIAQGDIQVSQAGGAFAQTSAGSPTTTHDTDGWYAVPLTATDTATLGSLAVQVAMSGACPSGRTAWCSPANVWDSLFSTDKLQVDVVQIEGSDASDALAALDDATLTAIAALNDPTPAAVATPSGRKQSATTPGLPGSTAESLADGRCVGRRRPGGATTTVGVSDGSDPIEGARVWVSTDAAGANVIAGPLVTDSFGVVTLLLGRGRLLRLGAQRRLWPAAWQRSGGELTMADFNLVMTPVTPTPIVLDDLRDRLRRELHD